MKAARPERRQISEADFMQLYRGAQARAAVVARTLAVALFALLVQLPASQAEPAVMDEVRHAQEILTFGDMRLPRWLAETVARAAEGTNVDPAYLMALADKESSFLPANKAKTSSAEGLFQFIESTWLEVLHRYARKHGYTGIAEALHVVRGRPAVRNPKHRAWIMALRRDPYLSALMAGEMVRAFEEVLTGTAKRTPSGTELYMAHFLGVNGASRFLELLEESPDQSAPQEFPSAARANRALFFEAGREAAGTRARALTLAEVHAQLNAVITRRVARYESARRGVAPAKVANAN